MNKSFLIFFFFLLIHFNQAEDACSSNLECEALKLTCVNNTCIHCTKADQCHYNIFSFQNDCLKSKDKDNGICAHKNLIIPNIIDVFVSIFLIVSGSVAVAGGIGGGGIFIPVLILFGGFLPKVAIPLSKALIAGASIANYIQLYKKRHPTLDRPLIDYKLSLLMQPVAVGGTTLGVLLNHALPSYLITVLLAIVLSITTWRTWKKGVETWKKEKKKDEEIVEIEQMVQLEEESSEREENVNDTSSEKGINPRKSDSEHEIESEIPQQVLDLLEQEKSIPIKIVVILFAVLIGISFISLLKGTGTETSIVGVDGCSPLYWILVLSVFPIVGFVAWYAARKIIKENEIKKDANYALPEGDIDWTPKGTALILLISFIAGILAALLGIGGGMVLSPLMLELGVLPDVTSATGSFLIIFTSFSSVFQYLILGRLKLDYGIWFIFVGLGASIVGQTAISYVIARYKKKSIIVFSISFVIGISTILLVTTGTIDLFQQSHIPGFKGVCSVE